MTLIPTYKMTDVKAILAEAGTGAMPHIPAGDYKAVIVKSEMKPTKDGNGQYLQLGMVITEGPHRDTEFTERLNLVNANPKAVAIAYLALARIADAIGILDLNGIDSSALHNKPFLMKVIDEEGKPYIDNDGVQQMGKPRSVIDSDSRGYKPLPTVGSSSGANTSAPAKMPWEH